LQLKILIAPDKFKGTLDARQVSEAIQRGILRARPDLGPYATILCPIADGGDGTASVIVEALRGGWVPVETQDPLGRPIVARVGLVDMGGRTTAIVESATASGLALLRPDEKDPVHASTFGTGRLIEACLGAETKEISEISSIVVCVGGTATTDAGLGAICALGAKLYDQKGRLLDPYDAVLFETRGIDPGDLLSFSELDEGPLRVATDVESPLLGPSGAVSTFGPQKGIKPDEIPRFEEAMTRVCRLYEEVFGLDVSVLPRAGAGGGLAGGLAAACGAVLEDGFELVAAATKLRDLMADVDFVITGEGAVDRTSFEGKAIGKVVELSKLHDVRVVVIAGRIDEDVFPRPPVVAVLSLESLAGDSWDPMKDAARLVEIAATTWMGESDHGGID
jgi:glycerate kinase